MNKKQISDVMIPVAEDQMVQANDLFRLAVEKINCNRLGVVVVCDAQKRLSGLITDGDMRRIMFSNQDPLSRLYSKPVSSYMLPDPIVVSTQDTLESALEMLNKHKIWVLPVLDQSGKYVGILHLQYLLEYFIGFFSGSHSEKKTFIDS